MYNPKKTKGRDIFSLNIVLDLLLNNIMVSPAVNSNHKDTFYRFTWMDFPKNHLIHTALIQMWGWHNLILCCSVPMDEAVAVN